jgi:hypothetical protein
VYGNAVLSAFEEKGLEYFLKPINPKADVYCKSQANVVKATYNLIPATDTERINYSGEWNFYGKYAYDYDTNKDAKSYLGALGTLQGEEYGYGARYSYYLVDGLAQCYKYTNASFELTTFLL